MELYKTVRKEAEAEQVVERSRFITHVKPVSSREEADQFVASIRSRYKDATHNVPAMVIGDKSQIQWASDDGEPQGTSGAPIVQMLVSEGITDVAVVVTRYFGGIKLGTGGSVRAYTGSAKLGIEAAGICRVCEIWIMKVRMDYTFLAKVQNMAKKRLPDSGDETAEFTIGEISYADKVTMDIMTTPEQKENVADLISNITSGTAHVLEEKKILEKV